MKKIITNKYRFHAFTVVELMVGLAMTSILLSAGFFAYQLIQKQYRLFQKTSEKVSTYRNFQFLLDNQVREARYLELEDEELILSFADYKAAYKFEEEYVLRTDTRHLEHQDTFIVQAQPTEVKLGGDVIYFGLADAVELKLFPFGEAVSFKVVKDYSSLDLINYANR